MTKSMGLYCKAYLLGQLRAFPGWHAHSEVLARDEDGQARALVDNDVVYVQEDFSVTGGIFLGEDVIFDDLTDAWREYLHTQLAFEIPEDVLRADSASEAA